MTATDELRALLDELGVEWMPIAWNPQNETFYHAANGVGICADEYRDGVKFYTDAVVTPQQAIDATLGPEHTYTREDVEGAFVSGYSLGTLPVGSDPQWDENRQTVDEHMAELGWVRADATLGAGTCRNESEYPQMFFYCSECGCAHKRNRAYVDMPRFCPKCGRRVVTE